MTQALLFTALIPVSLLAVLGLVLVSGKLTPVARTWITRTFAVVLYGWLVVMATVKAIDYVGKADWLMAGLMAAAAFAFAFNGVLAVRRTQLFALGATPK